MLKYTKAAERRRGFPVRLSACGLMPAVVLLMGLMSSALLIAALAGDYLTEDEAARIREAQDLFPRTREYLRVAATRVAEVGRRMGRKYDVKVPEEKEKKSKKDKKRKHSGSAVVEEENPLLFYQLPDVVNGISQSLGAIMTNLDERFKLKRAEPTEIAKSLKLLQTFTSQDFSLLDDLEEKARKDEDEKLYRAAKNVRAELERARDGARQGLSVLQAPEGESKKRK